MKTKSIDNPLFNELKENNVIDDSSLKELYTKGLEPLPLTIRISSNTIYTSLLKNLFKPYQNSIIDDCYTIPNDCEKYKEYKLIIDNGVERNYIYRQELCSMIPPYLINKLREIYDIHTVLDYCAAPGSKSSQLVEYGFDVTSNDINEKRVMTLIHRLKSWNNVNVTNCTINDIERTFDCVLCDVPCTGDGTLRKSTAPWFNWKLSVSINNHLFVIIHQILNN